jgi:ferredoxin
VSGARPAAAGDRRERTGAVGRMRITVDRERCVGSGNCAYFAERVFDQAADGRVSLAVPEPGEELRPAARNAAANCPVAAIRIDED